MSERFARSCAGKKRYNSARRATEAAKAAQIIYAQEMNAYACEFCGRYHVGSTHPWEGRVARLEKETVITLW